MLKQLIRNNKLSRKRSVFKKEREYEDFLKIVLLIYVTSSIWGSLLTFLTHLETNYQTPRVEGKLLFLLFFPFMDLISRFFLQRVPNLKLRPYLVLPIKKILLVKSVLYASVKSFWFILFSIGYIIALVLLWTLKTTVQVKTTLTAYLLISFISIHFVHFFIKTGGRKIQNIFFGAYFLISLLGLLQYFGWVDFFPFLLKVNRIASHSFLTPLLMTGIGGFVIWRILEDLPHQITKASPSDISTKALPFQYFSKYGQIGKQLDQEIFMATRLKAVKSTLLFSLFWILYPLIVGMSMKESNIIFPFISLIFGQFISYGIIQYGYYCMSWHTYHFNALQLNKKFETILWGKYYFLLLVGLLISVLASVFYFFIQPSFIPYIWIGYFYNMGISIFLSLYFALKYTKPKNPYKNKSLYSNSQEMNIEGIVISFIYVLGMLIPYTIGRLLGNHEIGLVSVLLVSLVFILFRNQLMSKILQIFQKHRYTIYNKFKAFEK